MIFQNRTDAGERLTGQLTAYAERPDVIVLGLPRGGVPVAAVIARELHLPLDVFVVRKLGLPGYSELAMGAIARGGVVWLNHEVIHKLRLPHQIFEEAVARQEQELERCERTYRDDLPPPAVMEKTVILVDDGIATGSTMLAAIGALRDLEAAGIVVAAPVIAASTFGKIQRAADKVVALHLPDEFYGVGGFYQDFSQTTDAQVRELLAHNNHATPAASLL